MKKRILLLLVHLMIISSIALAGNTGKLTGTVLDAKTKEPLVGVNVTIVGTTIGAASGLDGNYVILNVPPNIYTVKAFILGYDPVIVNEVRVSIDLTTRQDFALNETVMEQKEVVITAERPIIQKDLTATTAVVGKEQIAALPVTEVGELLNLQAGFVAGSLRGGRTGEVAYWIDGVPVTDAYDGSQVVEVNKSLVQEAQLVSGAFNAEYGQAMSGIVNIATKEGGGKFTGGLSVYSGQYATRDNQDFPGLNKFTPAAIRNFEANLGGPVIGDNLSFFANGRYIYFDGWLKGIRKFNPSNIAYYDQVAGQYHLFRDTSSGMGDGEIVPMNSTERSYGQGKLTWRISPVLKINANYIFDHEKAKNYDRNYFLNPDGTGFNYNTSNTTIIQITHTLSSATFYTLGLSYFDRNLRYYLYDLQYQPLLDSLGNPDPSGDLVEVPNQAGPHYVHPKLALQDDPYSFLTGGTDPNIFRRETITKLAKFDISSQVSESNLVKFGVEFRKHHVFYETIQLQPVQGQSDIDLATVTSPYIQTRILPLTSNSHSMYNHTPTELSSYIQDKLEFKDFIVNIGVRFDYFDPNGVVLTDESDPNIYSPIKPDNQFFDYNGNGKQDPGEPTKTVDDRRAYWYKNASAKWQFSPRFGASFPITAGGVVHFSYGHFFQIPRFERLYENPDFKLGFGTGNQGIIGNADLNPEQTINGEIGVNQQLAEDISADVTAYMRDIRGLTGTRADEIIMFGGASKYSKYVNSDFGTVKGIILRIDKRFSGGFNATVDYTYQVARGSASDPAEARNAVAGGSLPEVQLNPLPWDQRQTINITAAYNAKGWGASFIGVYGSGTPYTPRRSADITTLLTNSQTKPTFFNLNAQAFYEIPLDIMKVVLFTRVINLLDLRDELGVFDDTGRAGFTTDEARVDLLNPRQRVNTVHDWFVVPTNYSEPRRIELGMNLEF